MTSQPDSKASPAGQTTTPNPAPAALPLVPKPAPTACADGTTVDGGSGGCDPGPKGDKGLEADEGI